MSEKKVVPGSAEHQEELLKHPVVKQGVPGINRRPRFEDSLAEQAAADEAAAKAAAASGKPNKDK